MSRTSTLILFGILTILTPFSGLPVSVRTLLTVVFGAGVAAIGLFIRTDEARRGGQGAPQETAQTVSSPLETEAPVAPSGVSPI